MTSRNSFFNILILTIRKRMLAVAVSLLGFFFVFPVYAGISVSLISNRVARNIFPQGVEKAIFARDVLGENNALIMFATMCLSVFIAFNCFSYLYNKSKVDFLHSLPVKRETLFLAEYVAGLITYIVPYIVFVIFAILIGTINGMVDGRGIVSALVALFINLLGFLGLYNITIIAIMFTGNVVVGALGTIAFIAYGPICYALKSGYEMAYFLTKATINADADLINKLISPLTKYLGLFDGISSYRGVYDFDVKRVGAYIIYIVISFTVALYLHKFRASEAAGKSMAFKKMMPVFAVLIMIPATLTGALMFEELTKTGITPSYGWFIFGFLAVLFLSHFVIQAIYYQDFRSLFKNMLNPLIAGAISAVIAVIFLFDLLGYDTYIPEDDAYVSAAVASYAMQGYVEYFDFDAEIDEYGTSYVGRDLLEYRLNNMAITDKEVIKELASAGISDTKEARELEKNSQMEYGMSYDDGYMYSAITIKYNMKNGKSVYRTYNINLPEHMDVYDKLYRNMDYKEVVCPMLGLPEEEISDIKFIGTFDEEKMNLSQDEMVQLVKAYQADVAEMDGYTLQKEVPYGFLCKKVTYTDRGYTEIFNTDKAYVYPSFTRTVALLEKFGARLDYYKNASNISKIVVTDYNNYDDFGQANQKEYTGKKEIAKILKNSYPCELVGVEYSIVPIEPIDIMVYFKDSPYGQWSTITYNCMKGGLPNFVTEDLGL